MLKREGKLTEWFDRGILPGGDVEKEIVACLAASDLFLALVSPDFLGSQYCYEREMAEAIGRHDTGSMWVVPIILEPCDWRASPLGRFKAIPRDGRPISEWPNANAAYYDVVTELRRLTMQPISAGAVRPVAIAPEADATAIKGDDELAVRHPRIAVREEPRDAKYLLDLGSALIGAGKYGEALMTLEEAYRLAVKEGDAIEVVKPLMLAGLYVGGPSGFETTIADGEQLATTSQGSDRALINRYLACAYGQKYAYNKNVLRLDGENEEQKRLRVLAYQALKRDLDARPGAAKEHERYFFRSLMYPAAGSSENDLVSFAAFVEFRQLLGGV
jgi:hypothetical protein